MNCVNCGAPLKAKSNLCTFCGTLNDTDLRAIGQGVKCVETEYPCPRCAEPLVTIRLLEGETLEVERCRKCLGIFFDPGELDALVDKSVSHVYEIDFQRMQAIIEEEAMPQAPVAYIKCPVCLKLMNRRQYGSRSGAIMDTCNEHGAWLDGGELSQILKWVKAGGQLLSKQKEEEKQRREVAKQKKQPTGFEPYNDEFSHHRGLGDDFLVSVIRGLARMLR